jgi:hypothetical protein
MVRRLKPRRGQSMSWMIVAVVVIALVIAIAVMIYMRTMGAVNAIATLTGSGATGPGDSLTLTVTASGGTVKIMGIVLLNGRGVVTAIGTTPGYSGTSPYCRLTGVYINSAPGPLNPPWVVQNGESASFIFNSPSGFVLYYRSTTTTTTTTTVTVSNGDCASVSQAIIFYNSGKATVIPIMG